MNKVAHLTSVHAHFSSRIFYKECKTLAQAGYRVVFVVQYDKNKEVDGIQIQGLPKPQNRFERIIRTSWQVYRLANQENAKIYHFHDPELIPIGLLLKAQGKAVIYDVHEDVPRQIISKNYIPKSIRYLVSWLFERLENFAARHFDAIVAATPFIENRFSKLGCYSINVNNYPISNELYSPQLDWSNKERAVCYVGGIADIRGISEMIEAIGQTDANLLLAGKFSSASQRQQAMSMDGWVDVKELGQLNRREVAQILRKSVAGLVLFHPQPNHINAQPNKMFEYMSAGIPVIASDFPLWREIVEGNQCGICVDPLNPQAISEAIQWLLEHPDEAKRMGKNGRKAVEEKYNWETEAEKLRSLYRELLS